MSEIEEVVQVPPIEELIDDVSDSLEVSVPILENVGATPGSSTSIRRGITRNRLLTISTTGECTVQDEPAPSKPDKGKKQQGSGQSHRKISLQNPFPSVGKFRGTAEDKILACILWLKRRSNEKQVKAGKVIGSQKLIKNIQLSNTLYLTKL